jgi:hypothetical protein
MAFQLSPGVLVVEKDLTGIVPAVATSIGGYVGAFQWGPVEKITTISNETELTKTFAKPNTTVAASWFSAANFLAYGNNLKVVRAVGTAAKNASAVKTASGTALTTVEITSTAGAFSCTASTLVVGDKVVITGTLGGTGTITGYATGTIYTVSVTNGTTTFTLQTDAGAAIVTTAGTPTGLTYKRVAPILIKNEDQWEAQYSTGAGAVGEYAAKFPGVLGNSLKVSACDASGFGAWAYKSSFDIAPGTSDYLVSLGNASAGDELHIVVVDEDGLWTGTPDTVLEKFAFASKGIDVKSTDGSNAYYRDVLRGSRYITWMDFPLTNTNWGSTASSTITYDVLGSSNYSLTGGVTDDAPATGALELGWDLFANAEIVDVNLLFNGPNSLAVGQYMIQVAQSRMDCIGFVSPLLASVQNNSGNEADAIIVDRQSTLNVNTSYGVMDSGWKYQYDKYNDLYRWVPLNADIAGLCARTDTIADPWFSPGGLNRGQIKNVVKLAYSPNKTDRDELYKNGINPVVSFPGEGTVLFGDKTLLDKPSAFDRINVRRLFIVLEKAIATAGKYQLFEFNDAFTRAQFRNLVEPFLRDVRGRRGIYDFRVVCDETNNTGEVIDRNEFVADIFIKPSRSINFMQLNFIATRTGVSFEEVVGA